MQCMWFSAGWVVGTWFFSKQQQLEIAGWNPGWDPSVTSLLPQSKNLGRLGHVPTSFWRFLNGEIMLPSVMQGALRYHWIIGQLCQFPNYRLGQICPLPIVFPIYMSGNNEFLLRPSSYSRQYIYLVVCEDVFRPQKNSIQYHWRLLEALYLLCWKHKWIQKKINQQLCVLSETKLC